MDSDFDDQLLAAVRRWSTEKAHEDAREQRGRTRWQEQLASDEMQFSGALLDAHESGASVELHVGSDRRHFGVLSALGSDFCAVSTEESPTVLVLLASVNGLKVEGSPRQVGPASSRSIPDHPALADVLTDLSTERPRLLFRFRSSAAPLSGELTAVGADVLTVAMNSPATTTIFVPVGQLCEVSLSR